MSGPNTYGRAPQKSISSSFRVDSNEFYVHTKVARHSRRVQVQAEVPALEAELCV